MSVNKDNEETLHQLESRLQQLESHLRRLESQRKEEEYEQYAQEEAQRRGAKKGLGCGLIMAAINIGIYLSINTPGLSAFPGLICGLWIFILVLGIGGLLLFVNGFEQ